MLCVMIICLSFILVTVLWRTLWSVNLLDFLDPQKWSTKRQLSQYLACQYCRSLSGDTGGENCGAFAPNLAPATTKLSRKGTLTVILTCNQKLIENSLGWELNLTFVIASNWRQWQEIVNVRNLPQPGDGEWGRTVRREGETGEEQKNLKQHI